MRFANAYFVDKYTYKVSLQHNYTNYSGVPNKRTYMLIVLSKKIYPTRGFHLHN